MQRGKQSIIFKEGPYLISSASVVGKKEGEGPLGELFDIIEETDLFGEDSWEEAESTMQKEACQIALGKAGLKPEDIRLMFGGDLLRQGIVTSMGARQFEIHRSVCMAPVLLLAKRLHWELCAWRQAMASICLL